MAQTNAAASSPANGKEAKQPTVKKPTIAELIAEQNAAHQKKAPKFVRINSTNGPRPTLSRTRSSSRPGSHGSSASNSRDASPTRTRAQSSQTRTPLSRAKTMNRTRDYSMPAKTPKASVTKSPSGSGPVNPASSPTPLPATETDGAPVIVIDDDKQAIEITSEPPSEPSENLDHQQEIPEQNEEETEKSETDTNSEVSSEEPKEQAQIVFTRRPSQVDYPCIHALFFSVLLSTLALSSPSPSSPPSSRQFQISIATQTHQS